MILTVTPNTALDRVLLVETFAFGHTERAAGMVVGMGGKGAVTSWVLGQIGVPSLATGLLAGDTGHQVERMLRDVGVHTDFVWVEGETRTNYVLVRQRDGAQGTVTTPGYEPSPEETRRLDDKVEALLAEADCLLCGGSLPPGMPADWYARWVQLAKVRGIPALLDVSGRYLEPNMAALPDICKPNEAEAAVLLGRPIRSMADAGDGVRELQARGIAVPIITLGEQGAIAACPEGVFAMPPLKVAVRNTAGAGDGFNAGLLAARMRGESWYEAFHWAVATATAVLLTPETGGCRREDVERLRRLVRIEKV